MNYTCTISSTRVFWQSLMIQFRVKYWPFGLCVNMQSPDRKAAGWFQTRGLLALRQRANHPRAAMQSSLPVIIC